MGLETGNYIYDLVQSNPPAGDQRKEGDDHLRLIKKVLQQTFPHITGPTLPVSTGSANAQLVTHLFGPPAYLPGQIVAFVAGFTNTGAMTLAVNGGAAKNVYINGAPAPASSIIVNGLYVLMYDGVQFQMAGSFGLGGYLPLSGGTLTGQLTVSPAAGGAQIIVNKPTGGAGVPNNLTGQTVGLNRWVLQLGSGIAESGSNAGSDFNINRYTDAGTLIDSPLSILRASGAISLTNLSIVAASNANFTLSKAASGNANVINGATAGSIRWQIIPGDSGPEGGSNTGSNFYIARYTDAGAFIDQPLAINRASGQATFGGSLYSNGGFIATSGAAGSNRAMAWATSGTLRYQMYADNTAEGGSNAGSNFNFISHADSGALLGTVFSVVRSTRVVSFAVAIVNGPSDRSLKENIRPLDGALDKIMALKGVSFNFIKDKAKRQIGLIAQDVAPIVPEVIQDFIQPDEEPKLAVDYTRLVPVLIEAIKELTARIEMLEMKGAKDG